MHITHGDWLYVGIFMLFQPLQQKYSVPGDPAFFPPLVPQGLKVSEIIYQQTTQPLAQQE